MTEADLGSFAEGSFALIGVEIVRIASKPSNTAIGRSLAPPFLEDALERGLILELPLRQARFGSVLTIRVRQRRQQIRPQRADGGPAVLGVEGQSGIPSRAPHMAF